jgi:hypothetical protein
MPNAMKKNGLDEGAREMEKVLPRRRELLSSSHLPPSLTST